MLHRIIRSGWSSFVSVDSCSFSGLDHGFVESTQGNRSKASIQVSPAERLVILQVEKADQRGRKADYPISIEMTENEALRLVAAICNRLVAAGADPPLTHSPK